MKKRRVDRAASGRAL